MVSACDGMCYLSCKRRLCLCLFCIFFDCLLTLTLVACCGSFKQVFAINYRSELSKEVTKSFSSWQGASRSWFSVAGIVIVDRCCWTGVIWLFKVPSSWVMLWVSCFARSLLSSFASLSNIFSIPLEANYFRFSSHSWDYSIKSYWVANSVTIRAYSCIRNACKFCSRRWLRSSLRICTRSCTLSSCWSRWASFCKASGCCWFC